MKTSVRAIPWLGLLLVGALLPAARLLAHCDTMDGPVVQTAKLALEKGDPTPVLKWVRSEEEGKIREAFARTLAVRARGTEAKALADTWFFETLVRIHRAGEGAPYEGLEPEGTPIEPSIALADKALATGDPEGLVRRISGRVADGIRERFDRAAEAKKHAEESVAKGREFVAAYVELTHYAERLDADAASAGAPHGHGETKAATAHEH